MSTEALLYDEDKPVVYRVLTAYFALQPLEEEDAERIERVNDLVLSWFGDQLRWTHNNAWPVTEPFESDDLGFIPTFAQDLGLPEPSDDPHAQIAEHLEAITRTDYAVTCHGARYMNEASPFAYRAYGVVDEVPAGSAFKPLLVLRLSVPEDWPLDDFRERVLAMTEVLRVRWGSAGLGFSGAEEAYHNRFWATLYAEARRHPGLDIPAYIPYMRETHERLRSVSWLTLLGPELASSLLSEVQRQHVGLEQAGATTVLVAGKRPDPGDINQLNIPAAYREADLLVRRIRLSEGITFMAPFDETSTAKWLCRFE